MRNENQNGKVDDNNLEKILGFKVGDEVVTTNDKCGFKKGVAFTVAGLFENKPNQFVPETCYWIQARNDMYNLTCGKDDIEKVNKTEVR